MQRAMQTKAGGARRHGGDAEPIGITPALASNQCDSGASHVGSAHLPLAVHRNPLVARMPLQESSTSNQGSHGALKTFRHRGFLSNVRHLAIV